MEILIFHVVVGKDFPPDDKTLHNYPGLDAELAVHWQYAIMLAITQWEDPFGSLVFFIIKMRKNTNTYKVCSGLFDLVLITRIQLKAHFLTKVTKTTH